MRIAIFVDVQNDFVKEGKLPYAFPAQPNHQNIIKFAKECRMRGYQMFATVDTHERTVRERVGDPESKPISGYLTTYEGNNLPIEHCIEGTEGHKIIEGLVKDEQKNIIIPQGHIVDKNTFGSFTLLYLIEKMMHAIKEPLDEILICGYCTSICVVSNALLLRANFPNTPITVISDLCGDVDEHSHLAALDVMKNCQVYSTLSDDVFCLPEAVS